MSDCTVISSISRDIWQAFRSRHELVKASTPTTAMSDFMLEYWQHTLITRWARVSPKVLPVGTRVEGMLDRTETDMFLTPMPLEQDAIRLELQKVVGHTRATARAYKVDARAEVSPLWVVQIASKPSNLDAPFSRHFSGVGGHLIAVTITTRRATRPFNYTLLLEPEAACGA